MGFFTQVRSEFDRLRDDLESRAELEPLRTAVAIPTIKSVIEYLEPPLAPPPLQPLRPLPDPGIGDPIDYPIEPELRPLPAAPFPTGVPTYQLSPSLITDTARIVNTLAPSPPVTGTALVPSVTVVPAPAGGAPTTVLLQETATACVGPWPVIVALLALLLVLR